METIIKGRLGYNLIEREWLKRDWHLYVPLLEDTKVDLIIEKNNQYLRLQIKLTTPKVIPVRKISHNKKEYKVFHYTKKDIDFFLAVDLDTENIYVMPISFVEQYSSSIGLKTAEKFKNNFSLLEPDNGNTISGEDDIGEGLTANPEGSDSTRRE